MKYIYSLVLVLNALTAFAGPQPLPPLHVCIDDDSSCTSPPPTGIKWHPGHYMLTWSVTTYTVSQLDDIASIPEVKGIQHRVYWADLEPTRDNYNFSLVEKLLADCQSRGKRLVLQIEDRAFKSTSASGKLPDYLQSDFNGIFVATATNGTSRVLAKIWKPEVMDRYIKLHQQLAARFNGEAFFEGIATEEVTPGIDPGTPGSEYDSRSQLSQQLIRFATAARLAWTKTNVFIYSNSLSGELDKIISAAATVGIGVGGPDVIPKNPPAGDQIITGLVGGIDYRRVTPIGFAVQAPELCGKEGCNLPADIYNYIVNQVGANYIFWLRFDASKGAAYSWQDGMLPVIRSNEVKTACPSNLACTTG